MFCRCVILSASLATRVAAPAGCLSAQVSSGIRHSFAATDAQTLSHRAPRHTGSHENLHKHTHLTSILLLKYIDTQAFDRLFSRSSEFTLLIYLLTLHCNTSIAECELPPRKPKTFEVLGPQPCPQVNSCPGHTALARGQRLRVHSSQRWRPGPLFRRLSTCFAIKWGHQGGDSGFVGLVCVFLGSSSGFSEGRAWCGTHASPLKDLSSTCPLAAQIKLPSCP